MQPIYTTDPQAQSADLMQTNIAQLRELFPELITEGADGVAVNVDVLKALVGDRTVSDADETYGLNWHGKRRARQLALTPSTGTLRPCPEDSVDWDNTQHLMIEGDNLEVLKLLQKSYANKVKLIYIDPPYNTGKDFVYPDNFQDSIKNYLALTGQTEGGQKLSSNTETSGRFHTDWLNMMYPRLKLARHLLREDGVIFISIDDNEVSNLRKLCDDIFGEENFIANIVWQKKYAVSNDDPGIGVMHDHLLVYQKAENFQRNLLPRTDWQKARYTNPDNDPRGPWAADNYVSNKSKTERPTLWYPIKHPITNDDVWPEEYAVWRYASETHTQMEQEGRLFWGKDYSYKKPRLKRYLYEVQQGVVPSTWWTFDDCGHNDEAQKETANLLEQKVFSTPKPVRLLQRILSIGSAKDSIVLDFFAGSGTTGHAVMAQNAADGGQRRCILVQLPEPLDPENKDQKTAAQFCDQLGKPRTIAELTKERLRRAASKIRAAHASNTGDGGQLSLENELQQPADAPLDLGFRVFKLDYSNIRAWHPQPSDLVQSLLDHQDSILPDRTEADVLYELLLKLGLDLCVPIAQRTIVGHPVHAVGGGVLLACLAPELAPNDIEALAAGIVAWHQELAPAGDTTCIFRDHAFADDVSKTNLTAILEQHGLRQVRSL